MDLLGVGASMGDEEAAVIVGVHGSLLSKFLVVYEDRCAGFSAAFHGVRVCEGIEQCACEGIEQCGSLLSSMSGGFVSWLGRVFLVVLVACWGGGGW